MRAVFFGESASTDWNRRILEDKYGDSYRHYDIDIRDRFPIENLFQEYSSDICLIIHKQTHLKLTK
ncbi:MULTISPECIES: hypothetical protein [unclassified Nostoc]|uniref:hypothetical protein n=1 Tax=unclassified Nostoc TaxID=2593658 RepID=UPI00263346AE|nr:hypothetical protein [Nostoc sp. S13]MDF5735651.1 hypothetical protein [Nostoc sp. S13]